MSERIEIIFGAKGNQKLGSDFSKLGMHLIVANQGMELLKKNFDKIKAVVGDVLEKGMAFTSQMSAVQAVARGSAAELKSLETEARRLGLTTVFTATQAGKAMEELARAGQDAGQIIRTTGDALNLAAASGLNLADAAKVVAIQMNVFKDTGITASEIVDLMNKTVISSPMHFEGLTYALQFAAGTAAAAGWDFKQLTQVLGAMAEKGIDSSKSGRALNMAISRLLNPTRQARDAMKKYGISVADLNPQVHDFANIIDTLHDKQVSLQDLFKIFSVEAGPKFFKIIQEGGDSIRKFAKKQDEANTAAETARTKLNNLTGDWILFKSALESLEITVFKQVNNELRETTQLLTSFIQSFNKFFESNNLFGSVLSYVKDVFLITELENQTKLMREFQKAVDDGTESLLKFNEPPKNEGFLGKIRSFLRDISSSAGLERQFFLLKEEERILKNAGQELQKASTYTRNFGDSVNYLDSWMLQAIKETKDFEDALNKMEAEKNPFSKENYEETFGGVGKASKDFEILRQSIKNFTESWGMWGTGGDFEDFADFFSGNTDTWISDLKNQLKSGFNVDFIQNIFDSESIKDFAEDFSGILYTNLKNGTDKWLQDMRDQLSKNAGLDYTNLDSNFDPFAGIPSFSFGSMLAETIKKVWDSIPFERIGNILGDAFASSKKVMRVFSEITNVIMGVVGILWDIFTSNEKFAEALKEVFSTFGKAIAPIVEAFIPVLKTISEGIKELAPFFQETARDLVPIIQELISFFRELMTALQPIIKTLTNTLIAILRDTIGSLGPAIIHLVEALQPIFELLGKILVPIAEMLNDDLAELIEIIVELLPLIEEILQIIVELMPVIKAIHTIMKAMLYSSLIPIAALLGGLKLSIDLARDGFTNLLKPLNDLTSALNNWNPWDQAGGGGSEGGGILLNLLTGGAGGFFGLASGTGTLSKDQLVRLPGMEPNAGLIKAHVGESVGNGGGNQFIFQIQAIDPQGSAKEIRRVIEEMQVTGRLRS